MTSIKKFFARMSAGLERAAASENLFLRAAAGMFALSAFLGTIGVIIFLTIVTYGVALVGFILGMGYYCYRTGGDQ